MNQSPVKCCMMAAMLIVLPAIAASAKDPKVDPHWAESLFNRREIDFGTVPAGLDCNPSVTISNHLNIPIHLVSISGEAGIRHQQPTRNDLQPGQSAAIELEPDTMRFRGRKKSAITVTFDRPEISEVRVQISGEIRSDLVVHPGRFDFGTIQAGGTAARAVAVCYLGDSEWKINSVTCPDKSFDVSFKETRREKKRDGKTEVDCDLTITRRHDAHGGKIDTRVVVELNDSRAKSFALIVSGDAVEKPAANVKDGEQPRKKSVEPNPANTKPALVAEPLVVDVWPGKTPGDVGIRGEETSRVHQSPLVGPTKLITNVSKPTLTIYRPPAEKNTGTAMIICPGGGYWDLYWELEGEEVAAWLNSIGMTGIILKYRVPRRSGDVKGVPAPGPLLDAQRAVSLVRSRAAEWGIDPKKIGMVGFSAGGHLALATATRFEKRTYEPIDAVDEVSSRPDFAVLCYSGYFKDKDKDGIVPTITIPADTPPIFLAHASDDKVSYGGSDSENSAFMYIALKRAGIPTELHIFATGDHDFGVRQNEKLPSSWPSLCVKWLRSQGLLKGSSRE